MIDSVPAQFADVNEAVDASEVNQGDEVLSVMKDDEIVCEYYDEQHMLGPDPREVRAVAKLLIGPLQDVKIEHRVVDTLELKARKDLKAHAVCQVMMALRDRLVRQALRAKTV